MKVCKLVSKLLTCQKRWGPKSAQFCPFRSFSGLIRPHFSLSTSSNKTGLLPGFVFYSLLCRLEFQSALAGTAGGRAPGERKLAMTAKTTESPPMDSALIPFVLRSSAFFPAAFIFSLVSFVPVNATFSLQPFISSHQRICSAFPSFHIYTFFPLQRCLLWQTCKVGLVCYTHTQNKKKHHIKAEQTQTDRLEGWAGVLECSLHHVTSLSLLKDYEGAPDLLQP